MITGAVDFAHATRAKARDDLVVAEPPANPCLPDHASRDGVNWR
jgi:hypothetical protein